MKDNSSEEHKSKKKVKGRKRCTRIENSDSEEENGKINNSKMSLLKHFIWNISKKDINMQMPPSQKEVHIQLILHQIWLIPVLI